MKNWQHWMQQGNLAWQNKELINAQICFEHALADVWPIWHQSTLLPVSWSTDEDDLILPTCCLVVTLRNLACCYDHLGQTDRARALLKQTQRWLHTALQQPDMPTPLIASLLIQQGELTAHLGDLFDSKPISRNENRTKESHIGNQINCHQNLQ